MTYIRVIGGWAARDDHVDCSDSVAAGDDDDDDRRARRRHNVALPVPGTMDRALITDAAGAARRPCLRVRFVRDVILIYITHTHTYTQKLQYTSCNDVIIRGARRVCAYVYDAARVQVVRVSQTCPDNTALRAPSSGR